MEVVPVQFTNTVICRMTVTFGTQWFEMMMTSVKIIANALLELPSGIQNALHQIMVIM